MRVCFSIFLYIFFKERKVFYDITMGHRKIKAKIVRSTY